MAYAADELVAFTRRHAATDRIGRGFGFILLSPLLFFMSIVLAALLEAVTPFLIGLVAASTSGIFGSVCVVQGLVQHVGASRELRRLYEARQLPPARLLR